MRRILYWQRTPDRKELIAKEQTWLNLIQEDELGSRFYNLRKNAAFMKVDYKQRSHASKLNWENPEYKENGINHLRQFDAKRRKNLSVVLKEKWQDPEYRRFQYELTQNPERNKKIGAANRGRKPTEETRRKMSEATKRREVDYYKRLQTAAHTPEALKKSSDARKGQKRSQETRERMRQARLGKPWSSTQREAYIRKWGNSPP
jgi:hypothetical protein